MHARHAGLAGSALSALDVPARDRLECSTLRDGCTAVDEQPRDVRGAEDADRSSGCDGEVTLGLRVSASAVDLDLRFDLDRNAERQLGHADG